MNSKQVLALDALNKGLRAKTLNSAYYVGVVGVAVYDYDGSIHKGIYPFMQDEPWGNPPLNYWIFRLVAIRGDYPRKQHGLLLHNEYRGMVSALKAYANPFWMGRISLLGASVVSWYCGESARQARAAHALHENLSWLAQPERANAVHTLDPRVVSYGWYSYNELPSCFKSE